ncbi:ATP-binding protein [Salinisphaera sp.]|uniref:ATP-binding protein n=1 Tax=Salinisphaera sp. TaxID=1914330 RepID=UPI002D76B2CA|nr:ATP-binding protein [Salinisphaera sp.]HET7313607.1 ATP-binding protein [Salinisphaera sp.]
MTSLEELRHWIAAPEAEHLEFKSARRNYHFEKLLDYCVALANEGGGKIILGVTDARPRTVVGTEAFAEPGRTSAGIHQNLSHRVPIEELAMDGRRVLVVHVPSRLPGTAWHHDGRYLRRAGDDLVPIPPEELQQMLSEGGPDFSATASQASLSDLDTEAVDAFRSRWARKSGKPELGNQSVEQLLTDAELIFDGRITIAALVLFGSREALGRYLAQTEIVFEYRSSDASGPAQDRLDLRRGFFSVYDELWQKINVRNDRQSYQDGLFRYDIATFDEIAVREALLNAVAHRDYRLGGSIFVRQYPRRLEIVSPGGFPVGITPDNILDQQNPRNRRIAEALARCGLIERSGQGLNLMVENAIRQSKPLPDFAGSSEHEVRLTLQGTVQDPAFIRYLEKVGAERLATFSTYDFLALDALRRKQPLSDVMRQRLPALVENGAVEKLGRGRGVRYILSRSMYGALGRSGTYTRERRLAHETNKELLLKHIRDNDEKGSALSVLCQVLPDLPERQVQSLLQELRGEGKVTLEGQRRWARWHLPDTKNDS